MTSSSYGCHYGVQPKADIGDTLSHCHTVIAWLGKLLKVLCFIWQGAMNVLLSFFYFATRVIYHVLKYEFCQTFVYMFIYMYSYMYLWSCSYTCSYNAFMFICSYVHENCLNCGFHSTQHLYLYLCVICIHINMIFILYESG